MSASSLNEASTSPDLNISNVPSDSCSSGSSELQMETQRSRRERRNSVFKGPLGTLNATFGFLFFCFSIILGPFTLYHIFFTKYWPVALIYLVWYYYDFKTPYKGGYRTKLSCYLPLLNGITEYFSTEIFKTVDLTPDKNYIFVCYPHGVISVSFIGNFISAYSKAKKLFPGLKMHYATIEHFYYTPIIREFILGTGGVSARRESLEYILGGKEKGNMLGLFAGGVSEIFYAAPNTYNIILKKRKGFVRIALKTGTSLVPVIGFGDNDIFEHVKSSPNSLISKIRSWLYKFAGIAFCVFKNIVPRKVIVTSVVGKPIDLPKLEHPTTEEIDHYHALFTEELIKLFNEHKSKYVKYPDATELVIVE